ncbi:MAG: response regulator [Candidatus Cloacimonetes bacterium]|nr:response regulator [Candidatus Cloacimonadota bacterium]
MSSILVVEDNIDMQFLLVNLLKKEGFEITTVSNGLEALNNIENIDPSLVLLDIRLPGMNGLEVLEKIRKLNRNIPIIMVTAYANIKDASRSIRLGAKAYITKPFDYIDLIKTIKRELKVISRGQNEKNYNFFNHINYIYTKSTGSDRFCLSV